MKLTDIGLRLGIAAAVAISGVSHAYLYVHGYRHIPNIGPSLLFQASVSCAVAVLLVVGGPGWLRLVAAALAGGSLVAFALSRTVGVLGFTEHGWEPSPHAAIDAVAEVLVVVLCAVWLLMNRRAAVAR